MASRKSSFRPLVQHLEDRTVPTVSVSLSGGGVLSIVGNAAADNVKVAQVGAKIRVQDLTTGVTKVFAANKVEVVKFQGNAGNDKFVSSVNKDVIAGGGAGNDAITTAGGEDTIDGGAGDDVLTGGAGADELTGGPGNDRLNGGAGNDTLTGGAGKDRLVGGADEDTFSGSEAEFIDFNDAEDTAG